MSIMSCFEKCWCEQSPCSNFPRPPNSSTIVRLRGSRHSSGNIFRGICPGFQRAPSTPAPVRSILARRGLELNSLTAATENADPCRTPFCGPDFCTVQSYRAGCQDCCDIDTRTCTNNYTNNYNSNPSTKPQFTCGRVDIQGRHHRRHCVCGRVLSSRCAFQVVCHSFSFYFHKLLTLN